MSTNTRLRNKTCGSKCSMAGGEVRSSCEPASLNGKLQEYAKCFRWKTESDNSVCTDKHDEQKPSSRLQM